MLQMMQPAARPGAQEEIWNFILRSNYEVHFFSEKLESNVIFLYFKCLPGTGENQISSLKMKLRVVVKSKT